MVSRIDTAFNPMNSNSFSSSKSKALKSIFNDFTNDDLDRTASQIKELIKNHTVLEKSLEHSPNKSLKDKLVRVGNLVNEGLTIEDIEAFVAEEKKSKLAPEPLIEPFTYDPNEIKNFSYILTSQLTNPIEDNQHEAFQTHQLEQEGNKLVIQAQFLESVPYFLAAATMDFPPAFLRLYFFQRHGFLKDSSANENWEKKTRDCIDWFKEQAKTGQPQRQYELGRCYELGLGVEKNLAEAFNWYQKSADQGNVLAMYNLGRAYLYGEGIREDFERALDLFEQAATQGCVSSAMGLADVYYKGGIVIQDFQKAVYWWELAAKQGHLKALALLANAYEKGEGVGKDFQKAFELYKLLAEKGNAQAQYKISECAVDPKQKVHWCRLAANQGLEEAQFNLGLSYYNGEGVEKNLEQAGYWLNLSYKSYKGNGAENDSVQLSLGNMFYEISKTTGIDTVQACRYWWERAAAKNNPQAQVKLVLLEKN